MKLMSTYDENELLARLKSGDHMAFEKIFHLYKTKMAANALRLLKSRALAEELLQDLFLKIWEQRARIDTSQSLNAYLYKVAANIAYDHFRKISRDKKLYDHLLAATAISYDPIESAVFNKESRTAIENAVAQLPLQQRKVFTLCKLEEKTYEEAADILNITTGTVNNHLTRANSALREYLQKNAGLSTPILIMILLQGVI